MADRKPVIGAAILAALTAYGIASKRQRRNRLTVSFADPSEGRLADHPHDIGHHGWREILKRLLGDINRDNLSLMSAGVAFYALLSLAPGFTALIALYGLVFDTSEVQRQVQYMEGMMPQEARRLIADQLTHIVQASNSKLGLGLVVSLAIALWSANSGTSSLMSALNVAYAEEERRSLLHYYASSLVLTLAFIVFGIASLLLVAIIPAVVGLLPFGDFGKTIVNWVRWPVLIVLFALGLAFIYRYAPCRREPRWRWVSWGAVAATALWIGGSALFSLYVGEFASYDKTYGSLGAVVVLLMWFYFSAFAVLLGGELNAEMEHQTARDTTRPPRKPMGKRGAFVADTLALPE
jgi:membrane protein